MKNLKELFNPDKLSTLLLYISILTFSIAFDLAHNPPSGWYQQFLPNLNGQPLSDVIFLDSLNGFAITDNDFSNDTGYILKTTNGGENWNIIFSSNRDFKEIQFINLNTGYVCGAQPQTGSRLLKTTNSGLNWFNINPPDPFLVYDDISVLNEDTIWLAASSGLTGGVFRTTNGGINWTQQINIAGNNPTNIYMYSKDIGYAAGTVLYKTTNSGQNWFEIPGGGFGDMHFINATTGWKCYGPIQKTTDGGNNWITLPIPPSGGFFNLSAIINFSVVGNDTIWGVGSRASTSLGFRGLIYKSTNGGQSWGYELPNIDSVNISRYFHSNFINDLFGWSYADINKGVHTVSGGDTTFYTGIKSNSNITPADFNIEQNYPNPFNPVTIINYELRITSYINLKIYNIKGIEIKTFVNKKQNPGKYQIEFEGSGLPSGVYFYSLLINGIIADTKKMILVR